MEFSERRETGKAEPSGFVSTANAVEAIEGAPHSMIGATISSAPKKRAVRSGFRIGFFRMKHLKIR